jgi:glutamyl-Q tRNA(Asp) synthetase
VRTRFAPSPTGLLHLGHAYSALMCWQAAREAGGECLLRHEDIDLTRVRAHFYEAAEEDLDWLGLDWPTPIRRQSAHLEEYAAMLARLVEMGVVFRCVRTRKEMAEAAASAPQAGDLADPFAAPSVPRLPEEEVDRRIAAGESFAWRFDPQAAAARLAGRTPGTVPMVVDEEQGPEPADPARLGQVILGRKDAPASYHLCVVHDDALQGVTHVIRGEDLRGAAHLHVTLQALLDLPSPRYRHHRLITDDHGRRLAKRDDATSLRALRAAGWSPGDVRRAVGL